MDVNGSTSDNNLDMTDMDLEQLQETSTMESYLNTSHDMPAQVEKHLEFIAANDKGDILLGSSNLTGRYWGGSVWYYTDPSLAPSIEGSRAALEYNGGVTDCVFIDNKRAIIAQDGGLIDFVTIKDGTTQIERTEQIEDHGYSVVSVKLMCNAHKAITAALDLGIRLWDCHTTACTHNFTPAHTQEVTSVAPHPTHPDLFLSSSLDGNVFIWDLRAPKPASCLFRDMDKCPTALAWVPGQTTDLNYVVGTLSGEVLLRDPKVTGNNIFSAHLFNRPVFRMVPNKFRNNQIAACANESKVQVFTIQNDKIKKTYCDDRHEDFARGLEWLNESTLLSCGWDKNVFTHSVTHEKDEVA